MRKKIKTALGTWKVYGLKFSEVHLIYDDLKNAIERDRLSHTFLRSLVPNFSGTVAIYYESKSIWFSRF